MSQKKTACISLLLTLVFLITSVLGVCANGICLPNYVTAQSQSQFQCCSLNDTGERDESIVLETDSDSDLAACACIRIQEKNAHISNTGGDSIPTVGPIVTCCFLYICGNETTVTFLSTRQLLDASVAIKHLRSVIIII